MKEGEGNPIANYDYYRMCFGDPAKLSESDNNPEYLMKKQLAADICKTVAPIRERIDAIYNDTDYLHRVTALGRDKARASASATLQLAREAVGFKPF